MNPRSIAEFQVDKQIAIGGQARIYRVTNKDSQIFAIKVYHQSHQEANQMFCQQSQLMESLDHKGILSPMQYRSQQIITFHNHEITRKNIVIMKFMENGDLMNRVIKNGKLNTCVILRIVKSVMQCLKYLLANQVYHCDIKPQNILLNQRFEPVLIDFGFIFSQFSTKNTNYPKQYYIAPQVKKGLPYTEKSEAFSLGVFIFILTMGCLPFKQTKHTDSNYRALLEGKHQVFWKNFEQNDESKLNSQIKKAINNLLQPNPKRRWAFSDLSESQWFNEDLISEEKYLRYFQERLQKNGKNEESGYDFPFTDNQETASKYIQDENT